MDSLFGRKKLTKANRPSATASTTSSNAELNDRSVPYDRVATGRSPVQVGTVSQGLRATGQISAPITNPTLTLDGTDLNLHAGLRRREDREQSFVDLGTQSSDDAARMMSPRRREQRLRSGTSSDGGSITGGYFSGARRRGESDASGPSTSRSNMVDFGAYAASTSSGSRTSNMPGSSRSIAQSESTMGGGESTMGGHSRYPASLLSNGSEALGSIAGQVKDHLPHQVRESIQHLRQSYYSASGIATSPTSGEFHLDRPNNPDEIDAMFERVRSERDIGEAANMTLDQKWGIVYAHEQDRWNQHKKQEALLRKAEGGKKGDAAVFAKDTPEWYLKKFMDQTITAKHVGSLTVSLRTLAIDWMHHFVALQGIQVVAQALKNISLKGSLRRNADVELEYELLKCLKLLLNYESGADDAVNHPTTINAIACSFSTPHLPSRRLVAEVLTFLCYYNNGVAHESVLKSLDALSAANNETGRYDYWFRSFLTTLEGRGKMGSLVGASSDIKKHGGQEAALTDYAQSNLILVNGILTVDDFELRLHYRSQMEAAGLRKILDTCHEFQHDLLEKQIKSYEKLAQQDQEVLVQNFDQEILRDLSDPFDVYRAILGSVEGTPAYPYFLSSLQHLLLIRTEPETKTKYYQLIDELVTSIVLDKKQNFSGGLSSAVGVSVARLVAQFGEQERSKLAEEEAATARREAMELRIQKERLEEEIALEGGGLVGNLKKKLASVEDKLQLSRRTTEGLEARLKEQKRGYEEQISQLELQINEIFRMIREGGIGGSTRGPNSGALDRTELIASLENQMERRKTIGILEGRHKKKADGGRGDSIIEEEEDEKEEDGDEGDRTTLPTPKAGEVSKRTLDGTSKRESKGLAPTESRPGRGSQFMDAEDEHVRQHTEENLARGTNMVYPHNSIQTHKSTRSSPVGPSPMKIPDGSSIALLEALKARVDRGLPGHTTTAESVFDGSTNTMDSGEVDPSQMSTLIDGTSASSVFSGHEGRYGKIINLEYPPTNHPALFSLKEEGSSDGPPPPPMQGGHSSIQTILATRKDVPLIAGTRMKQLQWNKLPQQIVDKTLWKDSELSREQEWVQKLFNEGVWREMEEDFRVKQLVIALMTKQKRVEPESVLDAQTKGQVENIIQQAKRFSPEEIAQQLLRMDPELCTENFLSDLKSVIPTPEQVGKLNVYRNADPEELGGLHPSDRLMVQLIKIDRLGPRLQGMLFRCQFDEQITLWEDNAKKLSEAGEALLRAPKFKELMSLILLIGNYMNGTGAKGGAYGFRVSSINKLVDTKSVNNTTLLHFLERTVSSHFPEMEDFLEELSKPADAYRVSLQDTKKGAKELKDGLRTLRNELQENFAELENSSNPNDMFGKKMWRFVGEAKDRLEDLLDEVTLADTTFLEVVKYYGEDDKNMSSTEFFGIFKTFVTSYQKCRSENQSYADEKAAIERRRQQAEEVKAARAKAETGPTEEETSMLDSLLEKLRAGDSVKTRARKRPSAKERLAARPTPLPLMPSPLSVLSENGEGDAVDVAKGMLALLKSDGFGPPGTDASIVPVPMSPTKRRGRIKSDPLLVEELRNLTEQSEQIMDDAEVVERPEEGRDPF